MCVCTYNCTYIYIYIHTRASEGSAVFRDLRCLLLRVVWHSQLAQGRQGSRELGSDGRQQTCGPNEESALTCPNRLQTINTHGSFEDLELKGVGFGHRSRGSVYDSRFPGFLWGSLRQRAATKNKTKPTTTLGFRV